MNETEKKIAENKLIKRLKEAKERIESGDYLTEEEFFKKEETTK